MWLQSFTRLIKRALRWATVNGIFSRKEIVLILWFNSGPLPSKWSLIQRLIENTVCITKSLPDQSNKTIAFITCSKTNNSVSDLVEGSLRSPTRTCIDFSGQAHIWIQYISESLVCSNKLFYLQTGRTAISETSKQMETGIINLDLEVSILSVCLDAWINSWRGYNFQTSLKIWNLLCIHSLNQTCGCAFKSSIFILVTAAIPSKSSLRGDVTWQKDAALQHGAFYWEFVELMLWMSLYTYTLTL